MIIVKLMGGLGNQMFQYALGRSLSRKLGVEFKMDKSFYDHQPPGVTPRVYELGVYKIVENFASQNEVDTMLKTKKLGLFLRLLRKLKLYKTKSDYIIEPSNDFYSQIFNVPDNKYLEGYFQSYKYFDSIRDLIIKDFTLKDSPIGKNLECLNKILSVNAVSAHIRRGDYVTDKKTNAYHGTCGPDYYAKALETIKQKVSNPYFFVFSDDIEWVKQNMNFGDQVTYVDWNGPDAGQEDLRLMAACQHFIIANSSFSWWGAYLATNPNKIVIAPQKWFTDPAKVPQDLIPPNWLRI